MFVSSFMWIARTREAFYKMTTYLKKGSWFVVIFSFCLKPSLLDQLRILSCSWVSCLICCTPSFSSFCDAIFLFFLLWILAFCLDLLLHLLFHSCKRLVDNTYPKGCTNNLKQGWCCHRAKGHLQCYGRISFNILISIEHLSHISNNVP